MSADRRLYQQGLSFAGVADGEIHDQYWRVPHAMNIVAVQIAIGVQGALPPNPFPMVDVYTTLFRNPGFVIANYGFDRYGPGVTAPLWAAFPSGTCVRVEKGEELILQHYAKCFNVEGITTITHAIVWYTKDS